MIRVDVESTFEPIIGSEIQSKELINYLMKDYEIDPDNITIICQSVLPMFSSSSFMASGLTFRSTIHFEFIFVYSTEYYMHYFTYSFPVFQALIIEDCLFTVVYSWLLYVD